jgi:hypothetical protein
MLNSVDRRTIPDHNLNRLKRYDQKFYGIKKGISFHKYMCPGTQHEGFSVPLGNLQTVCIGCYWRGNEVPMCQATALSLVFLVFTQKMFRWHYKPFAYFLRGRRTYLQGVTSSLLWYPDRTNPFLSAQLVHWYTCSRGNGAIMPEWHCLLGGRGKFHPLVVQARVVMESALTFSKSHFLTWDGGEVQC